MIQKYILKAGDSLSSIANEVYGDISAWRDIADRNGILIFSELPIGSAIDIPTREEVDKAISEAVDSVSSQVDSLDLSAIKQRTTGEIHQLISWIL